jgi:hypothetical protein
MRLNKNLFAVLKKKSGIKLSEGSGTLLPYCGTLWLN